jgi:hypothetical protein
MSPSLDNVSGNMIRSPRCTMFDRLGAELCLR